MDINKMEIQITLEDYKLIKSFYLEFTRKQISSNDFIIGWSELMPVVEKIVQLKGSHFLYDHTVLEIFMWGKSIVRIGNASMIENYYNGVVEFIKWYNAQKL
jgi:hypothetical protein